MELPPLHALLASLLLSSFAAAAQAPAPPVSGEYAGLLGPLHLVLHVQRNTAGRMTGSLDSPDQNAIGIPCDAFMQSGDHFSFTTPTVHGTYHGIVSSDGKTITGDWNQGSPTPLVFTQTRIDPIIAADRPFTLDGDWKGSLLTPAPLPLLIHVKRDSDGSERLTLDSPSQGAFALKGANVSIKDGAVSFDIPSVHGQYSGNAGLDGTTIIGTWSQGTPLTLKLTRIPPPSDKPTLADGTWAGILAAPDGPLHAILNVRSRADGSLYVTLDSPDQKAADIEATGATLNGSQFSFNVPKLNASYKGIISADGAAIEGTWAQAAPSPLRFVKSSATVAPSTPELRAPRQPPLTLPELKQRLDAELKPLIDNHAFAGAPPGIGVAIGVYSHGQRLTLTYGAAKEDSLFEIGSITKTFTGLILSEMVLDHTVALDTPIRELLPPGTVAKPDAPEITLLSLATHHSGLPRMPGNFHPADPANPYADYTDKDLYAFIAMTGVALKPNAKYEYSNYGMGLLGEALANKAGLPYNQLLQKKVLNPLHMDHTFIQLPSAEAPNFLSAHDGANHPVSKWDLVAFAPAGGIRSDVRDMLKYAEAQLHPPDTLAAAIQFQHILRADADPGKIAINWEYSPEVATFAHGGGTGGFTSFAFFSPDHDVAGVVLVNRSSNLAQSLGNKITALLEGFRPDPIQP